MIQINSQFNIGCVKFRHYITLVLVLVLILVLIFRYVLGGVGLVFSNHELG